MKLYIFILSVLLFSCIEQVNPENNDVVEEVRKEVEKAVTVEDVPKKKRVGKKKHPSAVSAE